jgi:hypothetical protein
MTLDCFGCYVSLESQCDWARLGLMANKFVVDDGVGPKVGWATFNFISRISCLVSMLRGGSARTNCWAVRQGQIGGSKQVGRSHLVKLVAVEMLYSNIDGYPR